MQYCDRKIQGIYRPLKQTIFRANLKHGVEEIKLSITDGAEWAVTYDREPAKVSRIFVIVSSLV
jgi:hypothetical protein